MDVLYARLLLVRSVIARISVSLSHASQPQQILSYIIYIYRKWLVRFVIGQICLGNSVIGQICDSSDL